MILAMDIGNTNIVMGYVDKNCNVNSLFRMKTDISRTAWQYASEIYGMLNIYGIDKNQLDGCIISSVVPPLTYSIKEAVRIVFHLDAKIVIPGMKTGLNILIDNPASVGSDMVVDAVAAINQYSVPAVIIDTGTATTFSVVDRNKNYLGGLIMPGVMISQEALTSRPNPERPDGGSIRSFVIDRPAERFWSFLGVKTPGLTCADELGMYVARQAAEALNAKENPAFQPVRKGIPKAHGLDLEARQRLIAEDPEYGNVVCFCEDVTLAEIRAAIRAGATTVDGVKRRVGATMGRCQGSRCRLKIEALLREEGIHAL